MTTSTAHFTSGMTLTFGDCLEPAMKITEPEDAQQYLAAYVAYLMRVWGETADDAQAIALGNIGYFSGYYNGETYDRMQRLFGAQHPVFSSNPFEAQP